MFLRLQEAAHGLVRLITIAPETDGAKEFIRRLADQVHISVGHTCSDYETAYRAFSQGADHVTLFSISMPPSPLARRACLARRLTRSMSCRS